MSGQVSASGPASVEAPAPPSHRLAIRAASFGILAVFLALGACAVWGAAMTYRADIAVKRATEASNAIEAARKSAGAERLVRRTAGAQPGDEARAQHREAAAALNDSLQQARMFSEPSARRLLDDLLARHTQYLRVAGPFAEGADDSPTLRLFDAARADNVRADSAFAALEAQLDVASDRFRLEALRLMGLLVAIQYRVLLGGPIFFTLGLLLAGLIWRMQRSLQHSGAARLVQDAVALSQTERRFRSLVLHAPDLQLICAGPGNVTFQNPAAEAVWLYAPGALVGTSILTMCHPDDQAALRAMWEQARPPEREGAEGAASRLVLRLRDGHGAWRRAEMVVTNLTTDTAVAGMSVQIRDVEAQAAREQELSRNVLHDRLTRLPNQVLLRDRLGQALVRASRRKDLVGVTLVEVTLAGGGRLDDEMVLEAATRIRACVRPQDTVGRWRDDVFVTVRELVVGEQDVVPVAQAIAAQFARPMKSAGRDMAVEPSIGIVLGDPRDGQPDELIRNAALAMQEARAARSGTARHVVFRPAVLSDTLDRIELASDLRGAVPRHVRADDGGSREFLVHYQPILSMATAETRGVEALMRWQHPTHGLVSPKDFIPMAEETGLIVPLGQWVLEEAARQVAAWQAQLKLDPHLTLSVNLSARQFAQPGLVADVSRALSAAGLAPGCLRLEVTEGTIMRDPDAAVRTLWSLKELGVQLAIDDFGSGYSALSYLKQLPLGLLKVDGSFVAGIGQDPEDTSIVRAIMSLAKSLGWGVTAEGIETAEQATLLEGWGCDFGQGYHFSRPLNEAEAGTFLRRSAEARARTRALLRAASLEA